MWISIRNCELVWGNNGNVQGNIIVIGFKSKEHR